MKKFGVATEPSPESQSLL